MPAVKPAWPGRLLDLTYADPITLKPASRGFDPRGAGVGLWVYRRLIDPRNFQPDSYPGSSGTTLVNWPQNDYWLGPMVGAQVTKADALAHVARAKQLSLSLLYWLQTECPRPDGQDRLERAATQSPTLSGRKTAWPRPRIFANRGESRPSLPCVEQHIGTDARRKLLKAQDVQAEPSPISSASAAIGSTCTRALAATITSISARCRFRFHSEP